MITKKSIAGAGSKNPAANRLSSKKVTKKSADQPRGIKRFWFYLPLPAFFNLLMFMVTVVALPRDNSLLAAASASNTEVFRDLSILLAIVWILGTVVSVLISPIIHDIYGRVGIRKIVTNFKRLFIIAAMLTLWAFLISMLYSGLLSIVTLSEYRAFLAAYVYGFGIGYSYTLAGFIFYLTKK
jgi:hypothetical protein